MQITKIGVISGNGKLPLICCNEMHRQGVSPIIALVEKNAYFDICSEFILERFSPGKINKILNYFKSHEVNHILLIGKVDKRRIFNPLNFDTSAFSIIRNMKNLTDASIMESIILFLEQNDFFVVDQRLYLKYMMLYDNKVIKKKISKKQMDIIDYGIPICQSISDLNIGQTVVLKNKAIVAVESIEGTDDTILRAGQHIEKGCIVIKLPSRNQSVKYDLPTIGLNTLKNIKKINGAGIVIKSNYTLIPEIDKVIRYANKNNIFIYGV